MATAGYSGKPVIEKLGLREGFTVLTLHAPPDYASQLGALPKGVLVRKRLVPDLDFIHYFTASEQDLITDFPSLKRGLAKTGMLWISWPKKSSSMKTDLSENAIREIGLRNGLVDVKVCAFDDTWSALKFVYRLAAR